MATTTTSTQKPVRELYNELTKKLVEISHLQGISGLLAWDQQVMMPDGAAASRATQSELLEGITHEKKTCPQMGSLIDQIYAVPESSLKTEFNEFELANIRDAKRKYDMEVKIPKEMAQKSAKLTAEGQTIWQKAYKEDKWDLFAPILKEWIDLKKAMCAHIDPKKHPYDVCIDQFERGMTAERLDALFRDIKPQLVTLIQKVMQKKAEKKTETKYLLKETKFELKKQTELCQKLSVDLGFDKKAGRLDVSVHPFTGGANYTDVRMTTRYKENDLSEGITGTVHETGHALYEQGRNTTHAFLPVSEALSMGIHESQSLLWERMVGLSEPFWKFFWPKVFATFPENYQSENSSEELWKRAYSEINEVNPDLIRVEADELTYPLHIILRFEIERGIFSGELNVDDLPKIWNTKMKEYLGVDVPSNRRGVLQDVHWSVGAFGYFPTYSLGAIYASQFFQQAEKEIPQLSDKLTRGEFTELRNWLKEKIHVKGSLYDSGEKLTHSVTGKELDSKVFIDYLQQKYTKIYNL